MKKNIKITFLTLLFLICLIFISTLNIFKNHQIPITHNRVIYTSSQLSNDDILLICKKEYPGTKNTDRQGDKIYCFREEKNNDLITTNKILISTNKACDLKHPGDGTWASNGGTHCDDSYLKPKWEK